MSDRTDVIVIGAGIAGLSAAASLVKSGQNVKILEARPKAGGRILTLHDSNLEVPIELGAEFVHGKSDVLWELINRFNLSTSEVANNHWHIENGRVESGEDSWKNFELIMSAVSEFDSDDNSFADFLDQNFSGIAWQHARHQALSYVQGFDAAYADKISTLSLALERRASNAISGDSSFRLVGGYDQMVQSLVSSLGPEAALHLGTVVRQVKWKRGLVEVLAQAGSETHTYTARRAVITLPLPVFLADCTEPGAVAFLPPLIDKVAAAETQCMGNVARLVLTFKQRFWEQLTVSSDQDGLSLSELGFVHSDHRLNAIPTWWTLMPIRAPILVGWAAGPSADQLVGRSKEYVVEKAIDSLQSIFSISRAELHDQLIGTYYYDWTTDPFSRGAYSYVSVGQLDKRKKLASPIDDTLFFAGEATDFTGNWATVHGAIATGKRAAREILEC